MPMLLLGILLPLSLRSSAKWEIRPIFFKEISFFDFLEESTHIVL